MEERRVVVTGIGVITPLGLTVDELWDNLVNCQNSVCKISRFDASEHTCQIASEIKNFNPDDYLNPKQSKKWIYLFSMQQVLLLIV